MTTFITSHCNVIPLGEQSELNYILLGFHFLVHIFFRNVASERREFERHLPASSSADAFFMDAERDSWDSISFVSFQYRFSLILLEQLHLCVCF